jgi:adenylate cyclase
MMQQTNAAATGEGAAMIATQYESAGELSEAYEWFMRAATGYGPRDIRAARGSWEQAARVADQMPGDHPNCLAMRISPRALLCGSAFQVGGVPETTGFEELRDITAAAGDKKSLAVGMAGHLNTLTFNSRYREAVHTASEFAALVESIGEPEMAVGLLYGAARPILKPVRRSKASGWRSALSTSRTATPSWGTSSSDLRLPGPLP